MSHRLIGLWLLATIVLATTVVPGQEIINSTDNAIELVNQLCLPPEKRELDGGPQGDLRREIRREHIIDQLVRLGTNAWPVVPGLIAALSHPNFRVVAAVAEVLAGVQADRCPHWMPLQSSLAGQTNAFHAFRWLATGRDRYSRKFDLPHRRFGMLGLAAVGPIAQPVAPDLKGLLSSKEDYELWSPAIIALRGIGSDMSAFRPDLVRCLTNSDEHPNLRVATVPALIALSPGDPEIRAVLRPMLQDKSSGVRLAVAHALWELDARAEDVLPTLTELLHHKLGSIRLAALRELAELGPAAAPSRAAIQELREDVAEAVRQAAEDTMRSMGNPAKQTGQNGR